MHFHGCSYTWCCCANEWCKWNFVQRGRVLTQTHTPISHAVNSNLLQYVEELIQLLSQYQNEKAKIENSSVVVQIKCAVDPLSAERHFTHQMKYPGKPPDGNLRQEEGQDGARGLLAVCPNCGTLRCLSPRQCEWDKHQWWTEAVNYKNVMHK